MMSLAVRIGRKISVVLLGTRLGNEANNALARDTSDPPISTALLTKDT